MRGEHHRRRRFVRGEQFGGQSLHGRDRHVRHRAEPAHEEVADPRADGRGTDDDGERRERPPALELRHALAERVLELRESGR